MRKIVIEIGDDCGDCKLNLYREVGECYCPAFGYDAKNLKPCQACLDATEKERQDAQD